MKVHEAVAELLRMPQDHELLDEYAENEVSGFEVSTYEDDNGDVEYVKVEFSEVVG